MKSVRDGLVSLQPHNRTVPRAGQGGKLLVFKMAGWLAGEGESKTNCLVEKQQECLQDLVSCNWEAATTG